MRRAIAVLLAIYSPRGRVRSEGCFRDCDPRREAMPLQKAPDFFRAQIGRGVASDYSEKATGVEIDFHSVLAKCLKGSCVWERQGR
jgi:hypothetical protein